MLTLVLYAFYILISFAVSKACGLDYSQTSLFMDTFFYFTFAFIISFLPKKFVGIGYTIYAFFIAFSSFLFYCNYLENGQIFSITIINDLEASFLQHFEAYLVFLIVPLIFILSRHLTYIGKKTIVVAVVSINMLYPSITAIDIGRLEKQWNKEYVVNKYGFTLYHFADLIFNIPRNLSSYDEVEVPEEETETNEYTGLLEGQNLIVIHAESLEQFVIGMEVDGQEITPFLNQLIEKSVYCSNFYSQVSLGTSSDSEITFNTGLLPSQNGCTSINYYTTIDNALPTLLSREGYYTASFHANNGNCWNRKLFHKYLGYQNFYSKEDFEIDEVIGLGLSDISFFRQCLDYIDTFEQPFYTTMITLTNHTPFKGVDGELDLSSLEDKSARYKRYLQTVHYADSALEYLFSELESRGYLENTTIIIYGDHGALLGTEEQNQKVPLIIYSSKLEAQEITKVCGMYDCLPTIANLFNIETDYTLGSDIFSDSEGFVLFVDGSYIGYTD